MAGNWFEQNAPQGGSSGQAPSGMPWAKPTKDWTRDQVRGFVLDALKAKGITNPGDQVDYWTDKFFADDWVERGPEYWYKRFFESDVMNGRPTTGVGTDGGAGMGLDAPLLKGFGKEFSYSPDEILNSQAFKAAEQRGMQALERSAAAKGTVLGGGYIRDLGDWLQGNALDAIGADFNRKLSGMEFNRGTWWGDTDRQFDRLARFTQLGQAGADQLGGYGSGYGGATDAIAGNWAGNTTDQGQATAAAELAKGWAGGSGGGTNSLTLSGFGVGQPFDLSSITRRSKSGYR